MTGGAEQKGANGIPVAFDQHGAVGALLRDDVLTTELATDRFSDQPVVALAATFTAEPVGESVRFWMAELDIPCNVQFSGYNQVFQQLLDPASLLSTNRSGLNVILIRLEDWWPSAGVSQPGNHEGGDPPESFVERNCHDFLGAMRVASARSRVPFLVCFCPTSKRLLSNSAGPAFFQKIEKQIAQRLEEIAGVYAVTSEELAALYPVVDYDDARANEAGHVPYTREMFNASGTLIARRFYRIHTPPHKALVLDCDNTLWKGVCGEDGALGVTIGPEYAALQRFVIAQRSAGMLVCLCSKNNAEDVWNVFESNPAMILRREHLSASRINWQPKSENLRSLGTELALGIDSFIFLDDSALECAEVEARCPEVMTLQLPEQSAGFSKFLSHVWAFDHLKVTEEDRQRGDQYARNTERERLRAQSAGLEEFLASLELRISFTPMTKTELPRVAQLTQRTNQFNFTTIRYSENELEQHCSRGEASCVVVHLRDRFGDYGLVGAMIFSRRPGLLNVENMLLSCRALGRRVEHHMLSYLGRMARHEAIDKIRIHFASTPKNKPAREFLESLGGAANFVPATASHFDFDADAMFSFSQSSAQADACLS